MTSRNSTTTRRNRNIMAPDLNSVPPSPRPATSSSPRLTSRTASRRTSQQLQMAPPALPSSTSQSQSQLPTSPPHASTVSSMNILPSNQSAVNQTVSPPLASPNMTATGTSIGDNTGVGTGPGPLRHPRPLTAADLHLQLEKEQEAVVRHFLSLPSWHAMKPELIRRMNRSIV